MYSLLVNVFPGHMILKPHPQSMDNGCACWDHMTFNCHIVTTIASSPGSKGAHTQRLILNLTHETKRERGERERDGGREGGRRGVGTKREGDRDKASACVLEGEHKSHQYTN